jgi:hypothetical protein
MDKNLHLDSVIKTHQITKEESLLKKFKEKNKDVKEKLEGKYGESIYSPFNSGSYAKNTAINTKFDFDLVVPFKRNAFTANGTLKQMYDDIYEYLAEEYQGLATVIKQKVSIGIDFYSDIDGHKVKIDVVPGREFNQDQYVDDKNLNLYVNNKYGLFEEGADRLKTNIEAQLDNIKNRATSEKDSIRKIIRLLKVWKTSKGNYPTKSFFLELITIKAFDSSDISGSLWDKLKTVLEFIQANVIDDSFKLVDPGNSTNNLMDTLEDYEKKNLSNDMKNMLDRINEYDENIKIYFPENPKFKEENKGNYGVKSGMPTPPPKLNFG